MVQAAYAFVVFLSSACGLVIEIVAGRLIAPYVGMSLYTWTAIIAVVLAGFSAGHWIGGVLAGPGVDAREGGKRVAWALALAAVSSLASLVLLRLVSGALLGGGLSPISAIVLLTGALFFLPSLFVGIVSPILTKIAVETGSHGPGRIIGRMYAVGALGSIAGTLAAGYLFISWIGSSGTIITVAAVYAALALAFALRLRMGWGLVVAMTIAGGGFLWWGQRVAAFQSPCQVESDYFCIRIEDYSQDDERPVRIMVLDHLVHSINDRNDPGLLHSPYIHLVDEAAAVRFGPRSPVTAFFIGGGGYTLPRAWAAARPGSDLVVAEIDPSVTAAAKDNMWFDAAAAGLTVLHQDARVALQGLKPGPRFDVVFGDAFRDIAVPTHLVTREFHREIKARLKADGFYVVNVVDLGGDPRFLTSLVKTLGLDFAAVEVWQTVDEIDESGRVTFVVIASARPTPVSRIEARRGLWRVWARWSKAALGRRLAQADVPVLTDDFAPVDRLMSKLLLAPKQP